MAEGQRTLQARSIAAVLRELSVPAADALFDFLDESQCLSSARLACRALRTAIDGSTRELRINVQTSDKHLWQSGKLPSLSRWPRCTSVTLTWSAYVGDDVKAAALLGLPFAGMSLEARQRITKLAIVDHDDTLTVPECVVAMLLPRLPGLREVELHNLSGMTCKTMHQRVLYDSLACLSSLERLTLPDFRALAHLTTLAPAPATQAAASQRPPPSASGGGALLSAGASSSSGGASSSGGGGPCLTRLEVHGTHGGYKSRLDAKAVAAITRLTSLQELRFEECRMNDSGKDGAGADEDNDGDLDGGGCDMLKELLLALPPSVLEVHMSSCLFTPREEPYVDLRLILLDGKFMAVDVTEVSGSVLGLLDLANLARAFLSACVVAKGTYPHNDNHHDHRQPNDDPAAVVRSVTVAPAAAATGPLQQQQEQPYHTPLARLQPPRRVWPKVPRLKVRRLTVDDDEQMPDSDLDPIRVLLRCFASVEVNALRLGLHAGTDAALQAVEVMGRPARVDVSLPVRRLIRYDLLRFSLTDYPLATEGAAATSPAAAAAGSGKGAGSNADGGAARGGDDTPSPGSAHAAAAAAPGEAAESTDMMEAEKAAGDKGAQDDREDEDEPMEDGAEVPSPAPARAPGSLAAAAQTQAAAAAAKAGELPLVPPSADELTRAALAALAGAPEEEVVAVVPMVAVMLQTMSQTELRQEIKAVLAQMCGKTPGGPAPATAVPETAAAAAGATDAPEPPAAAGAPASGAASPADGAEGGPARAEPSAVVAGAEQREEAVRTSAPGGGGEGGGAGSGGSSDGPGPHYHQQQRDSGGATGGGRSVAVLPQAEQPEPERVMAMVGPEARAITSHLQPEVAAPTLAAPPPPAPATDAAVMKGPAAAAAAAAASDTSAGARPDVLLLQGPLVVLMTKQATMLRGWMQLLECHAAGASAGASGGAAAPTSSASKCIVSYQSLPSAATVVVACHSGRAAIVAAAAAGLMDGAGDAGGLLRVSRAAAACESDLWRGPSGALCAQLVFISSFQLVVQVVWNLWCRCRRDVGGEVSPEPLAWLISLRNQMLALPKVERIGDG